jgi:hypothetical protein
MSSSLVFVSYFSMETINTKQGGGEVKRKKKRNVDRNPVRQVEAIMLEALIR